MSDGCKEAARAEEQEAEAQEAEALDLLAHMVDGEELEPHHIISTAVAEIGALRGQREALRADNARLAQQLLGEQQVAEGLRQELEELRRHRGASFSDAARDDLRAERDAAKDIAEDLQRELGDLRIQLAEAREEGARLRGEVASSEKMILDLAGSLRRFEGRFDGAKALALEVVKALAEEMRCV